MMGFVQKKTQPLTLIGGSIIILCLFGVLVALAFVSGCSSKPAKEVINDIQAQSEIYLLPTRDGESKVLILTYDIIYDSCDYIMLGSYTGREVTMIHKGNCRNPIHQKENDTLKSILKELKTQREEYND